MNKQLQRDGESVESLPLTKNQWMTIYCALDWAHKTNTLLHKQRSSAESITLATIVGEHISGVHYEEHQALSKGDKS